MFNKLKNIIFNKIAKKHLNTFKRNRKFINYKDAKSVLLVFESDYTEKNPAIKKIIQILQQDNKKVIAWGYIDKKEVKTAILPDFRILHHKQTNLYNKPSTIYLNELCDLEFDLLIDLSLHPYLTLQYISLFANASCKAGVRQTEIPLYDFIIDVESIQSLNDESENTEDLIDELYLFNQIIFYLKSIQSND